MKTIKTNLFLLCCLILLFSSNEFVLADQFTAINFENIVADSARLSTSDIEANNDETNRLTDSSVVIYKTNEGRYGKFQVLHYGYSITLKWKTYNLDGTIYSEGDNLLINGTWVCDLDSGIQYSYNNPGRDFFWQQYAGVKRTMTPENNAKFALAATRLFLNNGNSYDFSEGLFGMYSGGDFYLAGLNFLANNVGQRGVTDLEDIGIVPLFKVTIPTSGYTRLGQPTQTGHTYVSLAQEGEESNRIVFQVHRIDGDGVYIDYLYLVGECVPIFPAASDSQTVETEFWVEVNVGNDSIPVSNLFGVSFDLNFSNTDFIDVVTPTSANVEAGSFLGSDLVFYATVNESAGTISVGISRKAGQGGVNGFGTVLRAKFIVNSSTPNGTQVEFFPTSVVANDAAGAPISLCPDTLIVTITSAEQPVLSVSPDTLDFGTDHNSLPFQISNSGSGTLIWDVAENPDKPWITLVMPPSGSDETTVTVSVDRSLLSGESDIGKLSVTSNGGNADVAVLITAEDLCVPIFPQCNTTQTVGSEFWVDVNVGTSTNPVTDLFGTSFELYFKDNTFIHVVSPYANNVIPGSFLGNDPVFLQTVDETAGKISIGISRKAGQGGVTGFGTILRAKFISDSSTPNGTIVSFFPTMVIATDPSASPLELCSDTLMVSFSSAANPVLTVDPTTLDFGETENSKTFQISNSGGGALNWGVTENPDKPWITSVSPASGTNDAIVTVTVDRSLLIGSSDNGMLSVTSNGGTENVTVHITGVSTNPPIYPETETTQDAGTEFWVDVKVGNSSNPVTDFFGVSFDLNFSYTDYLDVVTPTSGSVIAGDFLGDDLVFFPSVDDAAGKISVGISRKAGQGGVSGKGTVFRALFSSSAGTPNNTVVVFSVSNVVATDVSGSPLALSPDSLTVTIKTGTSIDQDRIVNPENFRLEQNFPNPFNPETTIEYSLPQSGEVQLMIYDTNGKEIQRLVNGIKSAGYFSTQWDGRNNLGQKVTSGVYFYRIEIRAQGLFFVDVKKMILMK